MSLNAGDKLGHYEVLSLLGKGGMGEVYRARDAKLDREVAIKVLPAALARNPERLARFEREAKVLAAMNHPNIAIIHGIEDAPNGSRAIVMELVEGPTLAERIKQGAIPMDEALKISLQIADALEAAHEKGVVHRDLKPANVKVREDGTVKVLDFGLATAVQAGARETGDGAESPTLTMGATEAGVILGTASYMAPEQARGLKVDKRADIWAFGVVLFEMLTGKRLFRGADVSDTLAGVLREEIDFNRAPAKVRPLLRRCLQRDPKQRLRDIGEARFLLEEGDSTQIPASTRGRPYWAAAAVLFLIAFAALAAVHFRETPPRPPNVRFQLQPPEKGEFAFPKLSPDGRMLAFVAKGQLWIHSFETFQSHPIAGTEGAITPFWSPNSEYLAFFAAGSLKKIAIAGGTPQILAQAPSGVGGSWSRNDVIVFAPSVPSPLFRVSAAGGTPVQVTKTNPGDFHLLPEFLPDGNHFLYSIVGGKERSGVVVGSLDGMPEVSLLPESVSVNLSDGHLLFRRGETLMAQPFDAAALRLTGEAFPIAEQVSGTLGYGNFSVSQKGMLVYVGGGRAGTVQLAWTDRTGKTVELFGPPGPYAHFRLSPDEKRIVYDIANTDIWVLDSVRGVPSKLTFGANDGDDNLPMWSPDGQRVVWPSHRSGVFDLYIKAANGTGADELFIKMGTPTGWGTDWSRDGRYVLFQRPGEKTGQDLWVAPQSSDGKGDTKPYPYLQTQFAEMEGRFSPDGKWVAYTSDETGVSEIYVQSFPISGAKFPISTGGGSEPQWSKDGTELFYLSADRTLMTVPITRSTAEPFKPGLPKALFRVPEVLVSGITARSYAVSNDGKRFLISNGDGTGTSPPLTVILNWRTK